MIGRIPVRRDSCMSRSLVPSRTMRSCTAMSQHRLIIVAGRGPIIRMFMQFIRKCKDLCDDSWLFAFHGLAADKLMALPFQDREKPLSVELMNPPFNWSNGRKFCWLTSNFQIKAGGRVWIRSAGRESRGANATMGASPDALSDQFPQHLPQIW